MTALFAGMSIPRMCGDEPLRLYRRPRLLPTFHPFHVCFSLHPDPTLVLISKPHGHPRLKGFPEGVQQERIVPVPFYSLPSFYFRQLDHPSDLDEIPASRLDLPARVNEFRSCIFPVLKLDRVLRFPDFPAGKTCPLDLLTIELGQDLFPPLLPVVRLLDPRFLNYFPRMMTIDEIAEIKDRTAPPTKSTRIKRCVFSILSIRSPVSLRWFSFFFRSVAIDLMIWSALFSISLSSRSCSIRSRTPVILVLLLFIDFRLDPGFFNIELPEPSPCASSPDGPVSPFRPDPLTLHLVRIGSEMNIRDVVDAPVPKGSVIDALLSSGREKGLVRQSRPPFPDPDQFPLPVARRIAPGFPAPAAPGILEKRFRAGGVIRIA